MTQTDPQFYPSRDEMKKALRLGQMPDGSDGDELLDDALLTAKMGIRNALGQSRIATILATAWTDSPTTDAQHLRALAAQTEIDWVRFRLGHLSPVRLHESIAGRHQTFQDEGFDRVMSQDERMVYLGHLWETIQQNLEHLKGTDTLGDGLSDTSDAEVIEPDDPSVGGYSIQY